MTAENEEHLARIAELEKEPEPPKGATKAVPVSKADDAGGGEDKDDALAKVAEALDKGDSNTAALELIKMVHSKGGQR